MKNNKQENCCTPIGQIKRYVDCKGCDRKPKQEQERMYSEEEVMDIIDSFIDNLEDYTPTFNSRQEWFEQFKKK